LVEALDPDRNLDSVTVWVADITGHGARALTESPAVRSHLAWAPAGDRLAYLAEGRLHIIDARTAQDFAPVNDGVRIRRFEWSPDSRRIAMVATPRPPTPARALTAEVELGGTPPAATGLFVLDVTSRALQRLAEPQGNIDDVSWSPDDDSIAFSARPTATAHDLAFSSDIFIVTVHDNRVRPLVTRPGMDVRPMWSPDGRWIAFLSHDAHVEYLGVTYLCVVSAAGGTPRNLTPQFDERILPVTNTDVLWSMDSGGIYMLVPRGLTRELWRVAVASGQATAVSRSERLFGALSISRDGRIMTLLASDPITPWELHVTSTDSFAPRRIATANPDLPSGVFGRAESVHWRTRDGQSLEGLLILPSAGNHPRPYPLVTYIHGGPSSAVTRAFAPQVPTPDLAQVEPLAPQLLPSRGYAVFLPNYRGSGGYGHAFMRSIVGHSPLREAADVESGIAHLVSTGIADKHRLAVMGWSAGGEITAWLISHSRPSGPQYRVAVVGAGEVDAVSAFGEMYHPDLMLSYMGVAPWQRPELYVAHSTIFVANQINTPTLILHGAEDQSVPVSQGRELFRALTENQVPTQLAVYPRQGHNFTEPALMRDAVSRALTWLDQWLDPATHE
jgi:dipeptidyl aminopeptidase/acylaminoacyl peptidase